MPLTGTNHNRIIYIDKDEHSIDQLYNSMKSNPRARDLNVFLMNILAPIDNYGHRSAYSRVQSDAVVALSLSNKLLLNEHAPIEVFLSAIKKCTSRYAFIDFLPFDPFSPIASIDCFNESSPQSRYRYQSTG